MKSTFKGDNVSRAMRHRTIELGDQVPANTHGGLLGEAYIHVVSNILEAVRQIRGTAVNQVSNAEYMLVAGGRGGIVLGEP